MYTSALAGGNEAFTLVLESGIRCCFTREFLLERSGSLELLNFVAKSPLNIHTHLIPKHSMRCPLKQLFSLRHRSLRSRALKEDSERDVESKRSSTDSTYDVMYEPKRETRRSSYEMVDIPDDAAQSNNDDAGYGR